MQHSQQQLEQLGEGAQDLFDAGYRSLPGLSLSLTICSLFCTSATPFAPVEEAFWLPEP